MRPRVVALIAMFLFIFLGLQLLIGWHGAVWLRVGFGLDVGAWYWIIFWFIALSYLIARLGARFWPEPVHLALKWLGSYWFAVLEYSVLLLPIADLLYAALSWLGGAEPGLTIRALGFAVLAALALILARGSYNAWNPIVRTYKIDIAKAAGGLSTLRIAAASDLHLGSVVGNRYLRRLVSELKGLRPDVIMLPGDVLDDDLKPFVRRGMDAILGELRAPYGVFAVLGNHEYIGGQVAAYAERMKAIGIELLMDRTVRVDDKFYVIGRKDKAAERFGTDGRQPLEALLEGVDRALPLVLLDHQPYGLGESARLGIDLSLSGHTHRGQMAPNHWITRRLFELDWGYLRKGALHAIVSSGYGTWGPPIRLGSRSEIVEVVIRFTGGEAGAQGAN